MTVPGAGRVQAAWGLHGLLRARAAGRAAARARHGGQEGLRGRAQAGGAAPAQSRRGGALSALCGGLRRLLPAEPGLRRAADRQAPASAQPTSRAAASKKALADPDASLWCQQQPPLHSLSKPELLLKLFLSLALPVMLRLLAEL